MMIEIEEIFILAAVGSIVLASGFHLSAESQALGELREQNQRAAEWALESEREPTGAHEVVTLRIVDDEVLDERNLHAGEIRDRLTNSFSTLAERGKTLEGVVGEPIPSRWSETMSSPEVRVNLDSGTEAAIVRW